MTGQIHKRVWQKRIMTAQNTISKDSSLSDSIFALSSRVRFVKQNLMSSESLLRIVVNKSHYPKYLVNYPFVPLTAILGRRIITHSRNHIYEYSHMCICKRIQEIIYVNIRMCAYVPLQWKLGVNPLRWKLAPTVEIRPQWKLRPYRGN